MYAAATLPSAIEHGYDMVYVCYDNKASINVGIQLPSSKRQVFTWRLNISSSRRRERQSPCSLPPVLGT